MNKLFWKNKKVLITGHTGFKGSWLSLWLQSCGSQVIGYALHPGVKPNLFENANVAEKMVSIFGDIRDLETLQSAFQKYKPEIIFHMAAQPLVRYSYNYPVETFAVNIMGTVNILEAVRHADSVRVVVNITSDKCYENKEWVWGYREADPMGGRDPYSSSKGCAELVTSSYRNSYFSGENFDCHRVAIATARAGNVIGGGDWSEDRLVPDVMRAFLDGRSAVIRYPNARRPWQHVLEPLSGYLFLAEKLWHDGSLFSQAWNFGPDDGDAKPVSWIVEYLVNVWGEGANWQVDKGNHPHEAHCLKLDCSKARALLGWTPKLHLSTALEWTCEFYKRYHNRENIHGIIKEQISRYENMVEL
ncbi:MAG: CDP-glucose 4,6-dehydratase [Candidatus Loosdrechtia sp.]|uniref:CDP-glucose 4,6-dehydratase n=1 Tax=Candidatus Loosdrechtia sp. TaxID=3101272 RepID=UPI00403B0E4D